MANQEHLEMLKQSVEAWNHWRREHPEVQPKLARASLQGAGLSRANLRGADLFRANLRAINLFRADLSRADLSRADLSAADLGEADLSRANLRGTELSRADLSAANFRATMFNSTLLTETSVKSAFMNSTFFVNVDLRRVRGLETVRHEGPSELSMSTVYRSHSDIPETFLRGTGVPDSFIAYLRSLVIQPIDDYYTCFISYAGQDQVFAVQLYVDLQSKGVRCWFAPEDMKIGDNFHTSIDESIRLYDKLLLVLSEHALASSWVEREVAAALEKEQQQEKPVLFPIRLDDTVMQTSQAWAADIRRRKHIGDFKKWKQHDAYQQAFERLLRDLKAEA